MICGSRNVRAVVTTGYGYPLNRPRDATIPKPFIPPPPHRPTGGCPPTGSGNRPPPTVHGRFGTRFPFPGQTVVTAGRDHVMYTGKRHGTYTDRLHGTYTDRLHGTHTDRLHGTHTDRLHGTHQGRYNGPSPGTIGEITREQP